MSDIPLTPADVDLIIAALDGSKFDTIVFETPRFSLKIAKATASEWSQDWRHTSSPGVALEYTALAELSAADEMLADGLFAVRPPLPGAFYRAPQPGAEPFVKLGDCIAAESIIGIVETMKVMNSVPAGVAGEIVAIIATDGEMVDQDTILIHVRP